MTVELEFDVGQKVRHRKTGMTGKIFSIELQKHGDTIFAVYNLIGEDSEGVPIAGLTIREHGFGLSKVEG